MLTNCLPSYAARVSLVSIAAFAGFLRNFYLLLELLLIIIFFDQTPLHLNLATSQVHPGHYLPFPTSSAASAHSTGGLIVPQPINATKVIMMMMTIDDDHFHHHHHISIVSPGWRRRRSATPPPCERGRPAQVPVQDVPTGKSCRLIKFIDDTLANLQKQG